MKKISVFFVLFVVVCVGWGLAHRGSPTGTSSISTKQEVHSPAAEPSPPDYLDLHVDDGDDSSSTIDFTVTVDSAIDSEYQIEVVSPKGAQFKSGYSSARFEANPDSSARTETLQISKSASSSVVVEVRLTLLDDNGDPWMVINKSHAVGETVADAGATRYPVMFERADGSKFVEYMTRDQAAERGLPIYDGSGEPVESPPNEPVDPGEDSDDAEVQQ